MNSSFDGVGGASFGAQGLSGHADPASGSGGGGGAAGAGASAFRQAMEAATRRAGAESRVGEADASMMAVPRARGVSDGAVNASFATLESRFATIQRDGVDLGAGFDATQPASAVMALERQVRLSKSVLEYQAILQAADNVKSAVKQLVQMQS